MWFLVVYVILISYLGALYHQKRKLGSVWCLWDKLILLCFVVEIQMLWLLVLSDGTVEPRAFTVLSLALRTPVSLSCLVLIRNKNGSLRLLKDFSHIFCCLVFELVWNLMFVRCNQILLDKSQFVHTLKLGLIHNRLIHLPTFTDGFYLPFFGTNSNYRSK